MLIEIVARVEDIVVNVEELSDLANFQPEMNVKSKQTHTHTHTHTHTYIYIYIPKHGPMFNWMHEY